MSYFRNLNKVVSSQLFTKPNKLLLNPSHRPVYLQTSEEATIEHLHSSKALLNTLNHLYQIKNNGSLGKVIDQEIDFLEECKEDYAEKVKQFIQKGGLLTGQGIANTYHCASKLNLSSEWLEKYIHHDIPSKVKYMNRTNLKDVLEGLKKFHSNSPYLSSVEQELSKKSESEPEFVSYLPNETTKFEYSSKDDSSNALLNTALRGQSVWRYYAQLILWKALHRGRYVLHSE